jgi:hypothetical protein
MPIILTTESLKEPRCRLNAIRIQNDRYLMEILSKKWRFQDAGVKSAVEESGRKNKNQVVNERRDCLKNRFANELLETGIRQQ